MAERATREWLTSPTMVTTFPSSEPNRSRSVNASRSPWLGCSCAPSPAETTAQPTLSATSCGAPPDWWRMTMTSGRIASRFLTVSTSVSPLVTEEELEVQLRTSAERVFPAISNELRVRVEASKNRLMIDLPRRLGTFLMGRRRTSFIVTARSITWRISSREYCDNAMQCLCRPITSPSSA